MTNLPEHKPYSASSLSIHLWATGAIADYMMYAMFALIPPFFTTSFGMDPVWVSWALVAPRLFDAFADPIIGHLSDNTHTPWGRRRPYIFVSGLIGPILIMSLWWMSTDWSSWVQFVFLLMMSLLLFLCWGTYTMNHQALGWEMSDDYHVRTKVIAVRGFYFSCAAMTGSYYYWFAGLKEVPRDFLGVHFSSIYHWIAGLQIFPKEIFGMRLSNFYHWVAGFKLFPTDVIGMRYESVAIAFAAFLTAMFAVRFSKERFQLANRKHVNIIEAVKATLGVKPFVILLSLRIIGAMGAGLSGATMFYIGVYSVCQGDKHLYLSLPIWNGWIGLAMAATLVFIAAKMSRFIGKRRGLIMSYGVGFLSACVLPFMAQPGWPYLLLAHMIIFGPIFATLLGVFQGAVMPDICDIDELQSGERREGAFLGGRFLYQQGGEFDPGPGGWLHCLVLGFQREARGGDSAHSANAGGADAPSLAWLHAGDRFFRDRFSPLLALSDHGKDDGGCARAARCAAGVGPGAGRLGGAGAVKRKLDRPFRARFVF